jgi:predicted DNA-binding mobile mystery protein A
MHSTNRKNLSTLGRWALDIELKPMRDLKPLARPSSGWIKVIREALGMTTGQFAKRLGVAQPRVAALERAEAEDAVTLKSLRHAAEALDCTLVYALVPNKPLERMVSDRAAQLADRQLALTSQTMRLENQAVSRARMARARQELAKEILQDDRRLWAEP